MIGRRQHRKLIAQPSYDTPKATVTIYGTINIETTSFVNNNVSTGKLPRLAVNKLIVFAVKTNIGNRTGKVTKGISIVLPPNDSAKSSVIVDSTKSTGSLAKTDVTNTYVLN